MGYGVILSELNIMKGIIARSGIFKLFFIIVIILGFRDLYLRNGCGYYFFIFL